MVSRTSSGSWSHGPWNDEMYFQCLQRKAAALVSVYIMTGSDEMARGNGGESEREIEESEGSTHLFLHMTSAEVEG